MACKYCTFSEIDVAGLLQTGEAITTYTDLIKPTEDFNGLKKDVVYLGTEEGARQINYCPMCGRKLSAKNE